MITEELLIIHDQLNAKASHRPWATVIRKRAGYGSLIFWSRKSGSEVIFDDENDARYLTFIRNLGPELVNEVRTLRNKLKILEEKLKEVEGVPKNG